MEITMEEEILNSNFESEKPILKAIRVYPFDDDYMHYTFLVKDKEWPSAFGLLDEAYDEWSKRYREEDISIKDLRYMCEEKLRLRKIFNISEFFNDDESDYSCNYETIG